MKHLRYILLSLLLITSTVYADYMADLVITGTSGIWTDSRSFTDLATAISTIGIDEVDLYISEEESVTTLTIPSNVRLHFVKSGAINNSSQLIINCKSIDAPNKQIFTGVGDIDFVQGSYVKSSWFNDLETAIDLTNDDYLTLEISDQAYLAGDASVGNNATLKFTSTVNKIIVNSGITLSNVHSIEAGLYQIFAGAGDIDFTDGTTLQLDWFRSLRSLTTWVESENVKVIVNGSNTVDYSQTSPQNIVYDLTNGSFAISNGITLTVFSRYNLLCGNNNDIATGLGTLAFTYDNSTAINYLDENILKQNDLYISTPTLASLQSITPKFAGQQKYIKGRTSTGDGGQGVFIWHVGDYTAQVIADTLSGIYAPSGADPAGSAGCWVRQYTRLLPEYFGAINSSSVDSAPIFEAIASGFPKSTVYLSDFYWLNSEMNLPDNFSIIGTGPATSGFVTNINAATIAFKAGDSATDVRLNKCVYRGFSIVGDTDTCLYGLYIFKPIKSLIENVIIWTGSASYGAIVEGAIGSKFSHFGVDNLTVELPLSVGTTAGPQGGAVLFQTNTVGTAFPINACELSTIYGRESGGIGFTMSSTDAGSVINNLYVESNAGRGCLFSGTRGMLVNGLWSEDNGAADLFEYNTNIRIHSFSAATAMDFTNDVSALLTGEVNEVRINASCTGFTVGQLKHSFNHGLDIIGGSIVDNGVNTQYVGPITRGDGGAAEFYGSENGTWTPALAFAGGVTGITYGTQTGTWDKQGNTITVSGNIVLTSKGSDTGLAYITLPFTAANIAGNENVCSVLASNASYTGVIIGQLSANSATMYLFVDNGGTLNNIADTNITNTTTLRFTISYMVQ